MNELSEQDELEITKLRLLLRIRIADDDLRLAVEAQAADAAIAEGTLTVDAIVWRDRLADAIAEHEVFGHVLDWHRA